jgi:hypothetical protein
MTTLLYSHSRCGPTLSCHIEVINLLTVIHNIEIHNLVLLRLSITVTKQIPLLSAYVLTCLLGNPTRGREAVE